MARRRKKKHVPDKVRKQCVELDKKFTLAKFGYFNRLVSDSSLLRAALTEYFNDEQTPTLPGLANYLGTTVERIVEVIMKPTRKRRESVTYLVQALQFIEDDLIKKGLTDEYNSNIVKMCLNVFHGRHEVKNNTKEPSTKIEIIIGNNTVEASAIEKLDKYVQVDQQQACSIINTENNRVKALEDAAEKVANDRWKVPETKGRKSTLKS